MHASEGDLAGCLVGVAGACLGLGDPEAAARLFGTAEALLDSLEPTLWPSDVLAYEKDRGEALRTLGENQFESLRSEGADVTADHAVDSGLEALKTALAGSEARSTTCERRLLVLRLWWPRHSPARSSGCRNH